MLPVPYWRLSGYYFFYFTFIGAYSPYFALYLRSLSFSAWDISLLMTQMQLMRLVGPFFWSSLVDRTGKRIAVIRLTGIVTFALFCIFFVVSRFGVVLAVMSCFAFFWVAALPLLETLTFDHLREKPERYSRIRLWGSVGFIAAVLGVGALLDRWPVDGVLWSCGFSLAMAGLCGLAVPEADVPHAPETHQPIGRVLRQPRVRALLAACFAMSAAHGAMNVFYTIFLIDHGYSKSAAGTLWTFGVLAEIVTFFFMAQLMRRFSLRQILLASLAAAVVRFVAIGQLVDHPVALVLTQLLHGLTFGAFHSAAVAAVNLWFPGNTRARGQALYSSVSFGAGGAAGGLASGWAWERLGGGEAFALGSLFAFIGLIILFLGVRAEDVGQNRSLCVVDGGSDVGERER